MNYKLVVHYTFKTAEKSNLKLKSPNIKSGSSALSVCLLLLLNKFNKTCKISQNGLTL